MGFHHAPDRSDDALDALSMTTRAATPAWSGRFSLAAEGQEAHFPSLES